MRAKIGEQFGLLTGERFSSVITEFKMQFEGTRRGVGIAPVKRLDNGAVLGQRQFLAPLRTEQAADALETEPRRLGDALDPLEAQGKINDGMEFQIEAVEAVAVARLTAAVW